MIVDNVRSTTASRVECAVRFESRIQRTHDIYVVTEGSQSLTPDANGFLLGAFLPAWMAGERRIRIDGAVCPLLAANLRLASSLMSGWFNDLGPVPAIESDYEYRQAGTAVAAFLSGGVDSLAMIRSLTSLRPIGHPDRPRAAVVVDYQYVGGIAREETDARFARSVETSREICADVGLDVIPVRSNLCQLNPDMAFWMYRYHGSFLASMAHFLSRDFRLFHIASSYPITNLVPWGSHPQLDPCYSSQHVRISHEGVELSRLAKVKQLRDWTLALDRMYVCTSRASNGENCGACEKCVRTKLHLLIERRLADAGAFAENDVSERDILSLTIGSEYARLCYEEALPGLQRIGRPDLAKAVETLVKAYRDKSTPSITSSAKSVLRRGASVLKKLTIR